MQSVIAHEQAHLSRHDHWWKPLGWAILTVYWFNPFCWVAYILLCRDIELACDEKVICNMDVEAKKAYSMALLSCSIPRRLISACPLAFGEVGVKERIKGVLHYKKPAFWVVAVAVIACVVAAVCFLTNPKEEVPDGIELADLDGDGGAERLLTEELTPNERYAVQIIRADGSTLWSAELGLPHTAWDAYFLYQDNGVNGILRYNPAMFQSFADYSYELYTFPNGVQTTYASGNVEFNTNPNSENPWPAEAATFAEEVNALLSHSKLLISTLDGELHQYGDNVINSLYARQASTKTKAAHRARAGSGMFIGSRAPFGYLKDPNDRHHLIVDPEAAEVVKSIFQMFADGIGYVRMTKILRERKILNPQAYFNQNNPDYYKNSDYWRKPFDWHATSVRMILDNPVYLGKVVFGRTKTKGFFDKHRIAADESEWVVAEHTHEAIITQELWDTVHQMMKARRRENGTGEIQPFAGLVKCADCGSSLNVSYDKRKGRYTGFSCWVYKNYGKERCTSHAIGWVTLNRLVLEDIRRNALEARRHVQDYMDMLMAVKEERQKADVERCRRELKKVDKRLDELTKILNKLYEDVALEKISEERYQAMAPKYEREQIELRSRREELAAEIAKNDEVYNNIQQFIPLIWKYTNIQELTPYILNELIEKIVVHEKVVGPDGVKTQQVDIYYKFIGLISRKAEGGCEGEVIKAVPTQREIQTA